MVNILSQRKLRVGPFTVTASKTDNNYTVFSVTVQEVEIMRQISMPNTEQILDRLQEAFENEKRAQTNRITLDLYQRLVEVALVQVSKDRESLEAARRSRSFFSVAPSRRRIGRPPAGRPRIGRPMPKEVE